PRCGPTSVQRWRPSRSTPTAKSPTWLSARWSCGRALPSPSVPRISIWSACWRWPLERTGWRATGRAARCCWRARWRSWIPKEIRGATPGCWRAWRARSGRSIEVPRRWRPRSERWRCCPRTMAGANGRCCWAGWPARACCAAACMTPGVTESRRWRQRAALLRRAIAIARENDDLDGVGYAYANLAEMLNLAGHTTDALAVAHEGLTAVPQRLGRGRDCMMLTVSELGFEAGDRASGRAHAG